MASHTCIHSSRDGSLTDLSQDEKLQLSILQEDLPIADSLWDGGMVTWTALSEEASENMTFGILNKRLPNLVLLLLI